MQPLHLAGPASPASVHFTGGELLALVEASGVLVFVAIALAVLLMALLPRGERRLAREPVMAFGLFVLFTLLDRLVPPHAKLPLPLESLALFALLASIGRSAFLLVTKTVLGRWLVRPMPKIVTDVVQGVIYAAALLITLDAAGVATTSLFTGSALVTAVIGLSMRDTLGNLTAGLAIQAQRPFDVGDWIQFDEHADHVGRVVEINWRATKVVTLDDVEVVIPNSALAQAPIRNFTKPQTHSRRSIFVVAPYDVPPRQVQRVLLEAIADAWGVLKEPAPTVVTHAFTDAGVEYWVRFFTAEFASRDRVDGGVRDRIWYAMSRSGIALPYPHRQVRLEQLNGETATLAEQAGFAERRLALRAVDFLRDLPDAALDRLASAARRRSYAEGETIIRQGERGSELFIITSGEVFVTAAGINGNGVEVGRLRAPKFFGEMSCMTGQPRSATVTAADDCELLVVSKADLAPLLAESPGLAEHISATLAARQVEREQKTSEQNGLPDLGVAERRRDLLERIRRFFSIRPPVAKVG